MCFVCMYVYAQLRPEEGNEFPGTVVTDGCEPLCGVLGIECWSSYKNKCSKPRAISYTLVTILVL